MLQLYLIDSKYVEVREHEILIVLVCPKMFVLLVFIYCGIMRGCSTLG